MIKPIYISADIYRHLDPGTAQRLAVYNRADQHFWTGSIFVAHPRYGKCSTWDFADHDIIGSAPALDVRSDSTFADVTDQRARDLADTMKVNDKRLVVFWSGGIDSTVVVSAIVKNFDACLLRRVDIFCNNSSYLENPFFFNRIIKDRISYHNMDSVYPDILQGMFANNLVTDGEPADKLWLVEIGLTYLQKNGIDSFKASLSDGRSQFHAFLCEYMTQDQADEYWHHVVDNIAEVSAPIETIAELFWWINFNYHWRGHLLYWYLRCQDKDSDTFAAYRANYHPWYSTDSYQTWSLSCSAEKRLFIQNLADYKMEAKRYIYDLDHNDAYLRHKTKMASSQRGPCKPGQSLVLFSDGSCLDDPGQISAFRQQYCLI